MRQIEYIASAEYQMREKPCFKQMSKPELRFVLSLKKRYFQAQAGEDIIKADKPNGGLYTLWEGWAFRYKSLPDTRRQILDFLLPGDLIGLDGWFNGGASSYSVQALTPASVCELDGQRLELAFSRYRSLAAGVVDSALDDGRRFGNTIVFLGQCTAAERLGWLLLDIFDRLVSRGMANGNSCPFPLQRRHLADGLGLSGTHVTRAMAFLQRQGLADISAATLVIFNRPKLEQLSSYMPRRGPPLLLL